MPSLFIVERTAINVKNIIFNYSDFYQFLKKTLNDFGYFVDEKKYTHNPNDGKNYIDFYWKCTKEIDDYSQNILEIDAKFFEIEDIKVMKEKRKELLDKGNALIKFKATLQTDYDKKWESSAFINFIKTIFENVFEKSSVNQYKEELKNEVYNIENEIKSYFNIQKMI